MKTSAELVDAARKRYESRVDRSGGPDSCHPWTGTTNQYGYGRLVVCGRREVASRFGWEIARGPIPKGMQVCHTCDNPPCQNPRHWFLGTHVDNSADMMAKGRHRRVANSRQKMTEDDVADLRRRAGNGDSTRDLMARFGLSKAHVNHIRSGKSWRVS